MARPFVQNALRVAAILIVLGCPRLALAQVSWGGAYAGADVGVGFKTLQFSVADGWFSPLTLSGAVDPGVNVGGHAGFDVRFKRLLVGGEAGFGYLGYHGEMIYGPAKDTKATTKGGAAWMAMGRVGWIYRQAAPYFGAGVMGSRNTATIVDDCNSSPCGSELGQGSGTATAMHWVLAYGVQFASSKRIAGRGWALRVDWLQVESGPITNVFSRDVTGPLVPGTITVTNTVRTPLSNGTLRILFDVRLTR